MRSTTGIRSFTYLRSTQSSRLAESSSPTTYTECVGRRRPRPDDAIRSRWGETIFRFVFTSLHQHGLFNADPHPGNYLFHEDGTVTFLDFGCVKRFATDRVSVMSAAGGRRSRM